jgi:copper(I)-binding protein
MKLLTILMTTLSALVFQTASANHVTVSQAWVRPTVPGQAVAGAYLEITAEDTARLIAVRSPLSPSVQIHWMQMDGNMMRMRQVQALDLPKNTPVSLKPGGYHLMLMKLKRPIHAGDTIPLTLVIETQGKRELLTVKAIAQQNSMEADGPSHDHMHH